jgi:putative endonuclease
MSYKIYILKSLKDGGYYIGFTSNIEKRLQQHQSGKVRSTRHRRPLILHYNEDFAKKTDAIKREHFLKSLSGFIWLKKQNIV